ncbi:penicillin-binding protein 1C [Carboxylicivirga sp. A043]|uniref:penicillin-binding protein 1C n=1 Tax=Carboxylicivirga litoralis TaxID=2816963 RepID=UPI0021CAE617|nr:penicillin-binding protein 1C [Carboxylicivirga sp. A043]MCU4156640.1 penicillin-binding protein 1C [Carboxylicivirga sp. A043]
MIEKRLLNLSGLLNLTGFLILKAMKMAFRSNKRKWFWTGLVLIAIAYYFCLPKQLFNTPYSFILNSRHGELLSAHIANDGQWRFEAGDSVPDKFEQAIIHFEDEYFRYHLGFNPVSLLRATWQNLIAGQIKSGGSTLSMQVIRLAYKRPRTVWNKLIETIQATRLELRYSKDEILNLYAAHAPFGGNVVGIEAAAWRYFGRAAHDLSWSESALLAVLPNAPSMIHPGKNREALMRKRNFLLNKLLDNHLIDSTEHYLACAEPLPDKPLPLPQKAPHLLNTLIQNHTDNSFNSTLNKNLQEQASQIVENFHSINRHNEIHNIAAIIIDNKTAEVKAYVGNSSFNTHGYGHDVDIIQSKRSTGSTLKPFLYAAALDDGLLLPQMLLSDIPTYYSDFSPQNYNKQFDGAVPAHTALSRSLNVPFVRLQDNYGTEKFHTLLRQLGISTINKPASHYGLSLILGGAETSLHELSSVYSSMARCLMTYTNESAQYDKNDFRLARLTNTDEGSEPQLSFQPTVLSAAAIYHTFVALTNVQRPEEETGWENFSSGRKIAWKTGTSYGFRDAWAVGVTPEYTVGVWVGNASGEGRPGIIGGSAAAPVLFELYRQLPPSSWFAAPYDNMQQTAICRQSGYKASQFCTDIDSVFIPAIQHDLPVCPYHHLVHLSADKQYRVNADCYPTEKMQHESWFTLPPVMAWYYQFRNPLYKTLPPFKKGCYEQQQAIEIIYPQANTQLFVPKEIDGSLGQIICKATHQKASTHLFWHLDNAYLGETVHHHQMAIAPEKGWHTLIVTDEDGNSERCRFESLGKGE